MPSPFPGTNLYLEQDDAWHDFLKKAQSAIAERLVVQVTPNSIVTIGEPVGVEIRDRQNRELISVIELLSPSNKRPGSDREQYLAKRETIPSSRTNFVELELLRGRFQWNHPDCRPRSP